MPTYSFTNEQFVYLKYLINTTPEHINIEGYKHLYCSTYIANTIIVSKANEKYKNIMFSACSREYPNNCDPLDTNGCTGNEKHTCEGTGVMAHRRCGANEDLQNDYCRDNSDKTCKDSNTCISSGKNDCESTSRFDCKTKNGCTIGAYNDCKDNGSTKTCTDGAINDCEADSLGNTCANNSSKVCSGNDDASNNCGMSSKNNCTGDAKYSCIGEYKANICRGGASNNCTDGAKKICSGNWFSSNNCTLFASNKCIPKENYVTVKQTDCSPPDNTNNHNNPGYTALTSSGISEHTTVLV